MAIALDSTSAVSATSTTVSVSHTCTGSNLILWVGLLLLSPTAPTSVTYDGVAMTGLPATSANGSTDKIYLYYLTNPATGAHNIVVNNSGSVNTTLMAASYTGAHQAGVPDNQVIVTDAVRTSITSTLNVGIPNSWLVGIYRNDVGAWTVGANTTERVEGSGSGHATILVDSNSAQASGSRAMTATCLSANTAAIMASFAPVFEVVDIALGSDTVVATPSSDQMESSPVSDSVVAKITFANLQKNSSSWVNVPKS